jgi:hypothetical protein
MKKPSESSRPVREDSPSRSVSARRQRLPGQGPRYCRCAAIALLDPVSSAVIAEKLDERSSFSASARRRCGVPELGQAAAVLANAGIAVVKIHRGVRGRT